MNFRKSTESDQGKKGGLLQETGKNNCWSAFKPNNQLEGLVIEIKMVILVYYCNTNLLRSFYFEFHKLTWPFPSTFGVILLQDTTTIFIMSSMDQKIHLELRLLVAAVC